MPMWEFFLYIKYRYKFRKISASYLMVCFESLRFTLVKEHLIEFNQLAMANHDGSEDMLNRVMTKDNIGLAAMLLVKPQAWSESLFKDNLFFFFFLQNFIYFVWWGGSFGLVFNRQFF